MRHAFRVRAVLTDIEGTTTSLSFVKDVLFPYARAALPAYVAAHEEELAPLLAGISINTLVQWIDEDRKAPVLKTIQGMIWADGYRSGAFRGHVYPDAAAALQRWHGQGIALYVYSSGSVAAQKLLYGHSEAGDLVPLFSGWFDLGVGSKLEAASYRRIVETIGGRPSEILFLSDSPGEIVAAQTAGLAVLQVDRQGPHDFGDITLELAS